MTLVGYLICEAPAYEDGQHIGYCAQRSPLLPPHSGRPTQLPDGWTERADGSHRCPFHGSGQAAKTAPTLTLMRRERKPDV